MSDEAKSHGARNAGVGLTLLSVLGLFAYSFPDLYREHIQAKIRESGLPADATVVAITPTGGSSVNNEPQVDLRLRVTLPERPPFEATVRLWISPVYLPQFQPGSIVKVKYDPKEPSSVAVDREY